MNLNILIVGDSLHNVSGLSKVSSILMKFLYEQDYNISYFGLSNSSISKDDYIFYGDDYKDCFYNCCLYDYKSNVFDNVCKKTNPDIVITIHDIWQLEFVYLSKYRHTFRWVNWCLFETPEYPEYVMGFTTDNSPRLDIGKILRSVDLNIPVTKMGLEALKKLRCGNISESNIYIGLDFSKVCKEDQLKSEVFGNTFSENDFVFMTVNKNLDRKRIDLVLDAFKLFLEKVKEPNKKKFKIYVHTDLNQRSGGTDLITQVLYNDLKCHFYAPMCFSRGEFMSTEELYKRYKACDCYIALPGGEGFGLSFLEALAHNKPTIYSDYGGHVEFCREYGRPVYIKDYIPSFGFYSKWAIADVDDAVRQMIWVYENKSKEHLNASKNLEKHFSWDIILDKFYSVLIKDFKENKKEFNFKRIV